MPQFNNVMEVLKLLEKSNCRKCNDATCMLFAAKVFKGERQISECPYISNEVSKKYGYQEKKSVGYQDDLENTIRLLKNKINLTEYSDRSFEAIIRGTNKWKISILS